MVVGCPQTMSASPAEEEVYHAISDYTTEEDGKVTELFVFSFQISQTVNASCNVALSKVRWWSEGSREG